MIWRLHSQNSDKEYGFEMPGLDDVPEELWDNGFEDFVEEQESEHGVHDWDGYRHPGQQWVNGYTSYEIEEDKYPELLEKYRAWFEAHGLECGESFVRDSQGH